VKSLIYKGNWEIRKNRRQKQKNNTEEKHLLMQKGHDTDRMKEAIVLADRCWSRAARAEPEFVEQYLASAEELLINRPIVMGDEFREHCRRRMIFLPKTLHHNTWVSGVRALNIMGWIEPIMKVTPEQRHNHMDKVTLWRSKITREQTPKKLPQLDLF
jgi:uncharacterized protein YeaC (DUF1315 family)